MRLIATSKRGASTTRTVQAVQTDNTRDALMSYARETGWDVVGHRWIRMTRGDVRIEVWFTDVAARVIRARLLHADGRVEDVDVVHDRDRRNSLGQVVMSWLAAAPTTGGGRVSASRSGEFEAIGPSYATRTATNGSDALLAPATSRSSGWIRTDAGAL